MNITIIGLPGAGKTTIFNALTGADAPVGAYMARPESHLGVAHVPDERVERLAEIYKPRRKVLAEVTFVDMPGPGAGEPGPGMFDGPALAQLQKADALLHVVRAFSDPSVVHMKGGVDWKRDARDVEFDLMFADIALIDRRIDRLSESKGLRASERDAQLKLIDDLRSVQASLEAGTPARSQTLSEGQRRALQDTFLLSRLPYLVAVNIGEDTLTETKEFEYKLEDMLSGSPAGGAAICGRLEMELARMNPEDEAELRSGMEAGEPGLHRILRTCYESLGLISFLTVGEDEVRAWTIAKGTPAAKAAGAVHSDIERGFIRAEVVSYEDLVEMRSINAIRTAGRLRSEGREYVVQDGDVVNFLFSV